MTVVSRRGASTVSGRTVENPSFGESEGLLIGYYNRKPHIPTYPQAHANTRGPNARLDPIAMQCSLEANLIGVKGDRGESEVKFICAEWAAEPNGECAGKPLTGNSESARR